MLSGVLVSGIPPFSPRCSYGYSRSARRGPTTLRQGAEQRAGAGPYVPGTPAVAGQSSNCCLGIWESRGSGSDPEVRPKLGLPKYPSKATLPLHRLEEPVVRLYGPTQTSLREEDLASYLKPPNPEIRAASVHLSNVPERGCFLNYSNQMLGGNPASLEHAQYKLRDPVCIPIHICTYTSYTYTYTNTYTHTHTCKTRYWSMLET